MWVKGRRTIVSRRTDWPNSSNLVEDAQSFREKYHDDAVFPSWQRLTDPVMADALQLGFGWNKVSERWSNWRSLMYAL